jgi:rSAM/selenodomain-associated transferase 1
MAGGKRIYGVALKFPAPGRVKVRLARDIGGEAAAKLYGILAQRLLWRTLPAKNVYERIIFFSPAEMRERFEEWIPGERFFPQRGDDLGEIMSNAFEEMFMLGAEKAVLTGTDIPGLHRGIIEQAFAGLDNSDVVIGPAKDGGYYLIGMKAQNPGLFCGPSWGTETVHEKTLSLADALGLSVGTVETLSDLDTYEDLLQLRETLRRS